MAEEQKEQNINTGSKPRKRKGFLLVLVMLIVIGALVFSGYYLGLNFASSEIYSKKLQAEKFSKEIKQLQEQCEQLQSNLQNLQDTVQKSDITRTQNWRPVIVEHLVRMADLTLSTTGDTKLALAFLLMAKEYADIPELLPIYQILNKDIADLQTIPLVDVSSLVLKIEALSQKISSLPLITQKLDSVPQQSSAEESFPVVNLWQRFFTSTTEALKGVVVIRRQTITPPLSPEQETILRLNLQTKLLQAESAVMQRRNKLYHACLEKITDLITRYFAANQIVNTDILPELAELKKVNLQPKLPYLSESLTTIRNFISTSQIQNRTNEEASSPESTSPNLNKEAESS